jgi:hypothetical protein
MLTLSKRLGPATLAGLLALGLVGPDSTAQAQRVSAFGTVVGQGGNQGIRPYFQVAPGLTLQQAAYNIRTMGSAYSAFPPWAAGFASPYALGYNPGPFTQTNPGIPQPGTAAAIANSAALNPGLTTYFPGYGGGIGYNTPIGGGASLTTGGLPGGGGGYGSYGSSGYDPYGGGYGGYGYPSYGDTAGGYLTGGAAVINAQSHFMVAAGQYGLLREQRTRERIANEKALIDLYLYRREKMPTAQDDRERISKLLTRGAMNTPEPGQIQSGAVLNTLLEDAQKVGRNLKASDLPEVQVDPSVLQSVNLTPGSGAGNTALLRTDGKLTWPVALQDADYRTEVNRVNEYLPDAIKGAIQHRTDASTINTLRDSVTRLRERLAANARDLPASQWRQAKRFLSDLEAGIDTLQRPDADQLLSLDLGKIKNVADLVNAMSTRGMRFAPSVEGQEASYNALQQALAAYDAALHQHQLAAAEQQNTGSK